jgi:mRNA-degrading endonuclease RelE of RelBE toxin-antitoxin system
MPWEILVQELATEELESLRAFEQRQIVQAIEAQLSHQPNVVTRRRKPLPALTPDFEHVPPVWEIRIGAFRVFYDINETAKQVHVRAIRRKGQGQTTKDIT